jgi:hypothetical protein
VNGRFMSAKKARIWTFPHLTPSGTSPFFIFLDKSFGCELKYAQYAPVLHHKNSEGALNARIRLCCLKCTRYISSGSCVVHVLYAKTNDSM